MTMISRFTRKWVFPEVHEEPIKVDYELVTQIEPVTFNDDKKTVKEYIERETYKVNKSKWADYIKSFDLGSVSEQILNHLTKGTPLVTAHTLPYGDYTPDALDKGAKLNALLKENNMTLEQLESLVNASKTEPDNGAVVTDGGAE